MGETRMVITHDDLPMHVAADADSAFVWLLRHQGQSVQYATTVAGWSFLEVPVWDIERRQELRRQAYSIISDPWHKNGHDGNDDDLTRENCAACALRGFGATDEGPNHGSWVRIYVETATPIPARWREAFRAEMRGENRAYADGILRDVATFGIRYGA